ncbi:hypothetical protein NGRA_2148, partial [Nosema granulosis]
MEENNISWPRKGWYGEAFLRILGFEGIEKPGENLKIQTLQDNKDFNQSLEEKGLNQQDLESENLLNINSLESPEREEEATDYYSSGGGSLEIENPVSTTKSLSNQIDKYTTDTPTNSILNTTDNSILNITDNSILNTTDNSILNTTD